MKNIEQIICETLKLPKDFKLSDDMTYKDIDNWDSLSQMELIATIEKEYNIEFDFEDMISLNSIGKIKEIVNNKR